MEPELIAVYLYIIGVQFTACSKMTFYGHPGVIDFYMKLRSDSKEGEDPFTDMHRDRRKSLCDALLTANLYSLSNGSLVSNRDPLQDVRPARNFQTIGPLMGFTENTLQHRQHYMWTSSEIILVQAFPCVVTREAVVILTYGFEQFQNRMFVLSGMIATHLFHMIGVLEVNPSLDRSHQSVNFRFSRSVRADDGASTSSTDSPKISTSLTLTMMGPLAVPTNLDLRLRSEFQYFRVCCSVANQIGQDPKFALNIKVYNYVHSMVEVHEVAKMIVDQNGHFLDYVHVLPCAINRPWDKPQFYFLRDRFCKTSVFVFLASEDEAHGEVLRVEGVVNEIVALSDK